MMAELGTWFVAGVGLALGFWVVSEVKALVVRLITWWFG